jgi:hypothetical protein
MRDRKQLQNGLVKNEEFFATWTGIKFGVNKTVVYESEDCTDADKRVDSILGQHCVELGYWGLIMRF